LSKPASLLGKFPDAGPGRDTDENYNNARGSSSDEAMSSDTGGRNRRAWRHCSLIRTALIPDSSLCWRIRVLTDQAARPGVEQRGFRRPFVARRVGDALQTADALQTEFLEVRVDAGQSPAEGW